MRRQPLPDGTLDATDRRILNALQDGFPLSPHPFAEAGEALGLPEVAHNYERAHALNMWFVLATEKPEGIKRAAARIERETGLKVLRFPKEHEFFIGFRVAA